jgi:hypothetical protein
LEKDAKAAGKKKVDGIIKRWYNKSVNYDNSGGFYEKADRFLYNE